MKEENVKIIAGYGDSGREWLLFRKPESVLSAYEARDVMPVLREVEAAVDRGLCAAGFLCYEAGPGLDPACTTHASSKLPLVWFGLFSGFEKTGLPRKASLDFSTGEWKPSISAVEYNGAIDRIKNYLKNGDTYQVNYTLRMRTSFEGDPFGLFCRLCSTQQAKHCVFVDTDSFAICSASPELFFSLDGNTIISRPMKGTFRRGLTLEQDREFADVLHHSEKNRAENVMIVDMVRNDMGRVADAGSIHVPRMFEIEKYPTVLQMTSTVEGSTLAPFSGIMKALFPCASITGAPKIRTMQIIKELESGPRGVYTGAIGYLLPGRKACFNVAIRTVVIDKAGKTAEYGVGGGIVWDSDAKNEYEECLVKTAVLTSEPGDWDLLESLLWEEGKGYFLLNEHMRRLGKSAEYFGFPAAIDQIRTRLKENEKKLAGRVKVRLLVDHDGNIKIENKFLSDADLTVQWTVKLAAEKVDSRNLFLYHKTTNRAVYDRAKSMSGNCDDVLLVNERGEITESTIANVVVERGGRLVTPPVDCGILPGVFREYLLEKGEIEEGVIMPADIREADKVFLINSVRKWIEIKVLF